MNKYDCLIWNMFTIFHSLVVTGTTGIANSPKRPSVKVNQPPGGKTAGSFW